MRASEPASARRSFLRIWATQIVLCVETSGVPRILGPRLAADNLDWRGHRLSARWAWPILRYWAEKRMLARDRLLAKSRPTIETIV